MAKKKKENRGGVRKGAGRPKELDEKDRKKSYTVSLKPSDKEAIVNEHGSLTKAIETTIPNKKTNKRK